jgi:diguanylate cyclase (GGDEF)-like protein
MSSIKGIWAIGLILICVAFFFFIYPRLDTLSYMPLLFSLIFRVLIFIAIFSYIAFLLFEIRNSQRKLKEVTTAPKVTPGVAFSQKYSSVETGFELNLDQDYQDVTVQILELAQRSLFAQTVFLYLFNEKLVQYKLQNYISTIKTELVLNFTANDQFFGQLQQATTPILLSGVQLLPEHLQYYSTFPKTGTLMLVPVHLNNGQFIGLLGVDSLDENAWGEEDQQLASRIGKLFSTIIAHLDTLDRLGNKMSFYQNLCRLNVGLSLTHNPLEFYRELAALCKQFFHFDKITVSLIEDNESQNLFAEYVAGYETDFGIGQKITVPDGLWEPIIRDGHSLCLPDYQATKLKFRFHADDPSQSPLHSAIGIPFKSGRESFGGLVLESFNTNHFTPQDLDKLEIIGKSASIVVSFIRIYQTMKNLAMVDGLTGISNHRAFKERLNTEIERNRRYGSKLTLLILDLDKFKRINDSYGHLFGNFVLRKIANIIHGSIRTIDAVARFGGEEFAVILININKSNSLMTAERIRKNIQSFVFEKGGVRERITISIGMAEHPSDADDAQTIIAQADMAMYRAKKAGGNQVIPYKSES